MKSLIWKIQENREKLREFLSDFVTQTDFTEETIVEVLEESEKNPDLRPTSRALRNFIGNKTKKPTKTEAFDTLACWVVKYVVEHSHKSLLEHRYFSDIKQLSMVIGASAAPTRTVSPQDLSAAMSLVASLLRADQADFSRLEKRVFRPTDECVEKNRFERHFLCYRYHSTPGYVVKSFLAIIGRSPEAPGICRFMHFSEGTSGGQRMSSGVILPFQNATYFLGHAGDGEGLKIIALRHFAPAKPVQEGLVLSFDDDSSLAAARIILVDTACRDSQSANIGVLRDADLDPEVAKYRSRLRNRIDFNLTEGLLLDGRPIDQQGMVVAVAEALKDADGNPKLKDSKGQAFNPAAKRHYTYNSALKIWSDNEDAT